MRDGPTKVDGTLSNGAGKLRQRPLEADKSTRCGQVLNKPFDKLERFLKRLRLAERLQVFLRLFKTHSGSFFLYRIGFASELSSYLRGWAGREKLFEQIDFTGCP